MAQPHHGAEHLIDERRDEAAARNARRTTVLLAGRVPRGDVVALAVGRDMAPGSGSAPETGHEMRR